MTQAESPVEGIVLFDEQSAGLELWRSVHEEVLDASFPRDQYVLPNSFEATEGPSLVACASDGTVVGAALGEHYPASETLLFGYLGVRPGWRGRGVGSMLMAAALDRWVGPETFAVLEIDDPRRHAAHDFYGDPWARARFYEQFDVQALSMPYFQPRLEPELPRAYHMMLSVVAAPRTLRRGASLEAAAVRAFLAEYFSVCEGEEPGDDEFAWMLSFCAEGTVELVSMNDIARLPDLDPPGCRGAQSH